MKDKYIIINKSVLEKRIDELKGYNDEPETTQLEIYKEILSQSTPLISEIEKAFDMGLQAIQENNGKLKITMPKAKQDYILNLKLNI